MPAAIFLYSIDPKKFRCTFLFVVSSCCNCRNHNSYECQNKCSHRNNHDRLSMVQTSHKPVFLLDSVQHRKIFIYRNKVKIIFSGKSCILNHTLPVRYCQSETLVKPSIQSCISGEMSMKGSAPDVKTYPAFS